MYERPNLQDAVESKKTYEEDEEEEEPLESASESSADPYTDFDMMGADMARLLSNPLNAADFEAKLRSKGIENMGVVVANIVRDSDGWSVQLSGGGPLTLDPEQGMFCRVADADTASIGLLKRVSIGSPYIEITGQVGEYELSLDPAAPRMNIVFDPCQVTGVPSPH